MNKKILICDDAELMRRVLKDILTGAGYTISGVAEDGEKACEIYKTQKPDLVIMDINMPKKDGLETLKEIKEMNQDASVVICSAMNQPKTVMEMLKAGASDFIIKPFQAKRVLEVVESIIGEA